MILDGPVLTFSLSKIGAGAAAVCVNGGVVLSIGVFIITTFASAPNSFLGIVMGAVSSKSDHSKGTRLSMGSRDLVTGHQRHGLRVQIASWW